MWSGSFTEILQENTTVWLSSLGTAYLLWIYIAKARIDLKFNQELPSAAFMFEEFLRSFCAIIILSVFERALCFTDCLQPTTEIPSVTIALLWSLWGALWADFHFYMQHRLLHSVPFLYRHVHSVHHRSYNIEPVSSLSMHPVEHIIYFTSVLIPPLVVSMPFWAVRLLGFMMII